MRQFENCIENDLLTSIVPHLFFINFPKYNFIQQSDLAFSNFQIIKLSNYQINETKS